jgi:hypothetical protein
MFITMVDRINPKKSFTMKKIILLVSFLAVVAISKGQEVRTTFSYGCPGSEVTFYLYPGSCFDAKVTSSGSWSVSPSGATITPVNTGSGAWNQVKVTFPSMTNLNSQSYTVSAGWSSSQCGNSGTAYSSSFTVYRSNTPSIGISSNKASICANETVTFTASPSGVPAINYTWSIDGVVQNGWNGTTFMTSAITSSSQVVTVTMYTASSSCSGVSSASASKSLSINTGTAGISINPAATSICVGQGLGFSASTSNAGSNYTIQWLVNGAPPTYTPDRLDMGQLYFIYDSWPYANNAVVSARITPSGQCSSLSNSVTIQLTPKQTMSVGISILPVRSSKQYCKDEIYFQATPTHATSQIDWYVNGSYATSGSTYDPTEILETDVISVVAFPATNPCVNSNSASYALNRSRSEDVFYIKPPVNASPIYCTNCSASGTIYLCQDPADTDFNSDITSSSGYSWSIENPAAGQIDIGTGLVNWSSSFIGQVKIFLSAQGCNGPVNRERTVYINPAVPLSISVSANKLDVCYEEGIMFHATHSLSGEPDNQFSLVWEVNNGGNGNWVTAPVTNAPQMGKNYLSIPWGYQTNSRLRVTLTTSKSCPVPSSKTAESQSITVRPKDAFSVTAGTLPSRFPRDYCADEISFKATPTHPTSQIYWYKNGAGPVQSGTLEYNPVSIESTDVITVVATPAMNDCVVQSSSSATVPTFRIKGNLYIQQLTCGGCTPMRCSNATSPTDFDASVQNPENDPITWTIQNAGASQINQNGVVTWDPAFTTGTATVKLSGTGCNGYQEQTKTIQTRPTLPPPTVELTGPQFICPGSLGKFTATNEQGAGQSPVFRFYVNQEQVFSATGVPPRELRIPDWPYSSGLNVHVTVQNTDNACFTSGDGYGSSAPIKVYTSIQNLVNITTSAGANTCQGVLSTQFTASPSITELTWSAVGANSVSNTGLVTWSPGYSGTAYVSVWPTSCPSSPSVSIPHEIKIAPPTPSNQNLSVCNFESIILDSKSPTGFARWFSMPGPTFVSEKPKFEVGRIAIPGVKTYYVESVSAGGCRSVSRAQVNIVITDDCDDKLNWIESRSFDPTTVLSGNAKVYYSYAGNALQTQVRSFETSKYFLSQPLADKFNTVVGSTLSAPTSQTNFRYNHRFLSGVNGEYGYKDFDLAENIDAPVPVDQTLVGSLGWYYSANNNVEENVPVTHYPYSRTLFHSDGSGEVTRGSMAGDQHRMGSNHEVASGTFPVYKEIEKYLEHRQNFFGLQAPALHEDFGTQSVARDENGKFVANISDRSGKSIMSFVPAVIGASPSDVVLIIDYEIKVGTHPEVEEPNPIAYFYLLHDAAVSIAGDGNYELENTITGIKKVTGQNFVGSNGKWPAGFYRVKALDEQIILTYSAHIKDISYQFYDDGGRLICSVSPNGVRSLEKENKPFEELDKTTYTYNHKGQLIRTNETDAGETKFKYRKDGQIRYSQNALQTANATSVNNKGKFSYTLYDVIGRPVESGEYIGSVSFDQLNPDESDDFASTEKTDWVRTYYDLPDQPIEFLPELEFNQQFVRGTVSKTENKNNKTWYSYDELGRLIWMAQKPTALQRTFVARYQYDYAGNVVTTVNESYDADGLIAPFFHHYEYDKDHRLVKVYTSIDGTTKELRASYSYYLHGPLKQIVLGNEIQKIDFVYNIHGWLTHINDPDQAFANQEDDNDAFGMVIDYYESAISGMFNTTSTTNPLLDGTFAAVPAGSFYFKDLLKRQYENSKGLLKKNSGETEGSNHNSLNEK